MKNISVPTIVKSLLHVFLWVTFMVSNTVGAVDPRGYVFFRDRYPTEAGFDYRSEACEYWRSHYVEVSGNTYDVVVVDAAEDDCTIDATHIKTGNTWRFATTVFWANDTYHASVPEEASPPKVCTGNPIEVSTGTKIQRETDVYSKGMGQINFERSYNNTFKEELLVWHHSYQKSLRFLDSQRVDALRKKSAPYLKKSVACTHGGSRILSELTDSWAQGASVRFINGACEIVKNNRVVKTLTILPKVVSSQRPPGAVQLVREDGSIYTFGYIDGVNFRPISGEYGQLEHVNGATVGWRFKTSGSDIEDYSAEGKLLSITAGNGMRQELFYDAITGLLSHVKDSTGRELLFIYTGNQISSVTVDDNKITSYTYNASGLLTQVTRPDNSTRIYHYENTNFPTALTGITDERGVRYATWKYDTQGRAISSEHAGGTDKTLLAFNTDGSTTVTNPLGKQTTYHFADIAGARRVTQVEGHATASCEGANQNYTYTPEGWIESKTDWKGNTTTFTYNATGQEISRTEASGTPQARTVTTEWHPDFYVKTRVVDAGRETLYVYDTHGRLLSTTTNSVLIQ